MIPSAEPYEIAIRGYALPATASPGNARPAADRSHPSLWTVVFDTETTTEAAQQLRFGTYQVREGDALRQSGFFYDPLSLSDAERSTLYRHAATHGWEVLLAIEFVEDVLFPILLALHGTAVAFNLTWDLSRLAIGHVAAKGSMRGGFSFQLSPDSKQPRVQVKHLNRSASLIRLTVPPRQPTPRGMRNRGLTVPPVRGHFVDVATIGNALTGRPHSLDSLAKLLNTPHQKAEADHAGPLTDDYLQYARTDTQVTWECFAALRDQYGQFGLTKTPLSAIYSEASIGKACLRQIGLRPWRDLQPDFPADLLGRIMSAYYGGRSEVRLRRQVMRTLYCDFRSMYPTVCTLMRLWEFVKAEGVVWTDATAETREFLQSFTLDDLQEPATWLRLRVLVQVLPQADLFPVRADYGDGAGHTIGLNYLTSAQPLWFTLADCLVSTLLTGKPSQVLQALRFDPVGEQADLAPLALMGNPAYRVDPHVDDLYQRLTELRQTAKAAKVAAEAVGDLARAEALDAEQLGLKIMGNATSYGIFVELNVHESALRRSVICHGPDGPGFLVGVDAVEEPGRYFHPLLATLITGGARLMLGIAERLASDAGLGWAFCDTDSIAFARPDGFAEPEFRARTDRVRAWFAPLNPFAGKGDLLKVEDANFRLQRGKRSPAIDELFCFAVSAKRYALFNLDGRRRPVLRKASAHGLGHLRPPYDEDQAPTTIPKPAVPLKELGVARWQYDVWHRIVEAALTQRSARVDYASLPAIDQPAVTRYAATSPRLLDWYRSYNADRPYREQVRPFGFLTAFQAKPRIRLDDASTRRSKRADRLDAPRAVAPFDRDPMIAASRCFDRRTGRAVAIDALKTYAEALATYHLHPEAKFTNGDYADAGETRRRHVEVDGIRHIGKEANRWEEQVHLGVDPKAQIEYGLAPCDADRRLETLRAAIRRFSVRAVAEASGLSIGVVAKVRSGRGTPTPATIARLRGGIQRLERDGERRAAEARRALEIAQTTVSALGLNETALRLGLSPSVLSRALSGTRRFSHNVLSALFTYRGNGDRESNSPVAPNNRSIK